MKRALLVIDVQDEYVSGRLPIAYPPVTHSLERIGAAMDAASARSIPVILVAHSAPEDSPVFARGSAGAAVRPEIESRPHDLFIEKELPSSFTGTPLEERLREMGIDTLVIAGYMTQLCCESTARDGVHRGFGVEFLSDATGTLALSNELGSLSAEQVHTGVLVVLHSEFAAVMSTERWIESLDSGTAIVGSDLIASTTAAASR